MEETKVGYLTTAEAAKYLGISKQHLEIARHRGSGPAYCRPSDSRIIRYRTDQLDAWMEIRSRQSVGRTAG